MQREKQETPIKYCIGCHTIKISKGTRVVIIDDIIVKLTPTEYRILTSFLNDCHLLDDTTLIHTALLTCFVDKKTRKLLEKHVNNIKLKLASTDFYIRRVQEYGYAFVLIGG